MLHQALGDLRRNHPSGDHPAKGRTDKQRRIPRKTEALIQQMPHSAQRHQRHDHQRRSNNAVHRDITEFPEGRDNQKTAAHPQQSGEPARHRTNGGQGGGALYIPLQSPGGRVHPTVLVRRSLSHVGAIRSGLHEHAPTDEYHYTTKHRHQRGARQQLGQVQSERGRQPAGTCHQPGRLVTHQPLAQTVQRAHCRRNTHGQQRHRSRLEQRPAQAQRQRRDGQNPAACSRQPEQQAHQHTQHDDQHNLAQSALQSVNHSRPLSMPFQ